MRFMECLRCLIATHSCLSLQQILCSYFAHFNNFRDFLPETPQRHNEITPGTPEGYSDDSQVHSPRDDKASPKSTPSYTQHTAEESAASPTARAYSPKEENELFSAEYVDKLVASFWSKVDQKIETAVSQYQSSPQAGQQTNTQDNAQTKTTETEDKQNGKTII